MTRALSAFFLLFGLIGLATAAPPKPHSSSVPSVNKLLSSAANAVRLESYRGVMVYLRGSELDTLKIVHRYHDDVEQERLVSLTGPPREVIRNGGKVTSILPQHHLVLISKRRSHGLLGSVTDFSPSRMAANYVVRDLGERRLAGRDCRLVSIEPKDKYRYGYRMLIDEKKRLPLKLDLVSGSNVLEQLMFTEISFPKAIPDSDFLPHYDVHGYQIIKHQAIQMDDPSVPEDRWQANNLPPGFRLAEDGVRQVTKNGYVRQMLFTDGVATVSAFIAPAGLRKPLQGASRMGAVHAYGQLDGDMQITVVGEVPAITARQIAQGLVKTKKK